MIENQLISDGPDRPDLRVAIVHYWLVSMRGGEKVIESLCEMFPNAVIYTHVLNTKSLSETIRNHQIVTTFVSRLPFASRFYKSYLPFMPLALETIDLTDFDLVISSEAGPAKGVITRPDCLHLCYCHSPMRYIWDQQWIYLRQSGWLTRLIAPLIFHRLRSWDITSSFLVDHFIANSSFVARRIDKIYRRKSVVIHPPVDVERYVVSQHPSKDFYLCLGQLTAYKRIDLAVEAATKLGWKLVIAGEGEESTRLKSLAGPTVNFLGRVSDDELTRLLQNCRALIFPGEEDFGIVPVEAMACGRPVIAFGGGGAAETVVDAVTGILFDRQSVESLIAGVRRFEELELGFDPVNSRDRALEFSRAIFSEKFGSFLQNAFKTSKHTPHRSLSDA